MRKLGKFCNYLLATDRLKANKEQELFFQTEYKRDSLRDLYSRCRLKKRIINKLETIKSAHKK